MQIRLTPRGVPVRGVASPMIIVYSFVTLAILGTLLLFLPIANTQTGFTPFVDALFTAVSAITVTGLVVVPSATYWSGFGQGVIFSLIFLGGLGFMTSAAFLLLLIGQRLGLQSQLAIREGLGVRQLGGIGSLVKGIVAVAIGVQAVGTLALYSRWFVFGSLWEGISGAEALWMSAFHSVSAFNNAGFVIFPPAHLPGASMASFAGDFAVLPLMMFLTLVGGLSFMVLRDLVVVRRPPRFSLDTKLVLVTSAALIAAGWAAFFATEFDNAATLGDRPVPEKAVDALYESINGRTAGFTTLDWGAMSDHSSVLMQALMFIGGASASTAGGIKVGTFAVIVATVFATIRRQRHVQTFGREIPFEVVRQAMVVGAVAAATVFTFAFIMLAIEDLPFKELLFETISAIGTVGLSQGITADLSEWGRGVLVLAMFIGRFGPISLALLMQGRGEEEPYRFAEERVRIG